VRMTLEPVRDLKIDLNASRTVNKARSVQYMYSGMPTTQSGSFNMTTISLKSALEGMGDANNGYSSKSFTRFCQSIESFRDRVQARYTGTTYPSGVYDANGVDLGGAQYNPELGMVNKYSADVLIPAFLSAYTSSGGSSLDIFPALKRMLPNWTVRYSGLSKLKWFNEHFKSVNVNHGYKSVFAVGSYATYSTFHEYMDGLGFINDATTGNPVPNSMYNVSTVSINEAFSPLLGVDVTLENNLTCKLEYRTTRVLSLSMTSVQINEALSKDWVIGMGYKISNFNLFGSGASRKIKKSQRGRGRKTEDNKSKQTATTNVRGGVNHDLNMRLDISFRKQASITRDIATITSAASSGNSAFKMSFMADYTLSRLITLSAYYDRQTNTPLLASSSYPTTTHDFGFSLKMSLTR
ncbi:cell surface protein SprA, partial [Bacteroides acidifaciens]|uniref:T9SS outer membrane translocon Sov/SprA n=1 Tax=Bacteroides acidifaciens TaxID=85831 RepID=UPI0025B3658C